MEQDGRAGGRKYARPLCLVGRLLMRTKQYIAVCRVLGREGEAPAEHKRRKRAGMLTVPFCQ
jgi:hypothetical protein